MSVLVVLVAVLLLTSFWDYKKGRIPNLLVATAYGYGILRSVYYQNFLIHIPGILFPILILYPFFRIGTIGAGDIKLFSVIGLYLSFMESVYCMFAAFLICGVYSVYSLRNYENLKERIAYLVSYLKDCTLKGHFKYYYLDSRGERLSLKEEQRTKVHMAFPIFISVLGYLGGLCL